MTDEALILAPMTVKGRGPGAFCVPLYICCTAAQLTMPNMQQVDALPEPDKSAFIASMQHYAEAWNVPLDLDALRAQ